MHTVKIMPVEEWLEVSLVVDGELVEAVADVLARFVNDGVVIQSVTTDPNLNGDVYPTGPMKVYGYLARDTNVENACKKLEEALWYLGRIKPIPAAQFKFIKTSDWTASWKKNYHPVKIGRKLVVIPAWLKKIDTDRIPIFIEPAMAFGTGTHPTTQLCLEFIEDLLLTDHHGSPRASEYGDVIDIGCGSGILSIAAVKLGAKCVLGVDVEAQAIKAARKNAKINDLGDRLRLNPGSVGEIRAGNFSFNQAHVVLANIITPVLVRLLADGLGHLLAPQGHLIVSGVLSDQLAQIETAFERNGLRVVAQRSITDWMGFCVKKADSSG